MDIMTSQLILDIKHLNVTFSVHGIKKPILENLSFHLDAQQTLGITGESGSGKSVTAMSILRLISTPPLYEMTGRIVYRNRDLMPISNREMRKLRGKEIGFIFQEPMTALNPVTTIGDQIAEMIMTHEKPKKKEAWERSIDLLKEVGIPIPEMRVKSYSHELSGGMRQRAMIAMAISCSPKILIADEPTTALDVTVQAQILELFKRLKEEHRMSLIFITHDLRVIAEMADQVMVMRYGKIVENAHVNDIFHSPVHPYTNKLLKLMTERGCHDRT
jgi:ABC-type dipeptide/oligopeptide/nickel transport system ATPase component